jgi:uncharacterized membrane protein
MHIVPNAAAWDAHKEVTQYWSGITIFPNKNTSWKNVENDAALKAANNKKYVFAAWCAIGLLAFAASVYLQPVLWHNIFGALSLIAVFVSIAAFATELGIQSNAIKQVCGVVSKGGCEAVLKSKLAKGIWGVTPSDIAVVYFAAQYMLYLLASFNPALFVILPYLAVAGLLIVATSIYTQAVIIKQWCALCLGIAFLLTAQAIISLIILNTNTSFTLSTLFTSPSLFTFFTLFILSLITLLPIKNILKQTITAKPKLAELKKWQTDATLFTTLLEKEQTVDTTIWENDLILGDINAPIMITVACNPYCGPCARAHKELDDMLDKFAGKIKVQVRFLCDPLNSEDEITKAVKSILSYSESEPNNNVLILKDWFADMSLEKWQLEYPEFNSETIHIRVDEKLILHNTWIENSDINFTPTFFVDGKKLPSRYYLKYLRKIIPQLIK